MAVVELLLCGERHSLLPPGHADASPGEVVVGQLEKVVQHGADGVVLVAVPLVVREPQPQLLGRHVAAAPDSDVAGRSRDGLARLLLRCGPSGRACCRPRGPRSTSGARALRRPWLCSAASSSRARAAALVGVAPRVSPCLLASAWKQKQHGVLDDARAGRAAGGCGSTPARPPTGFAATRRRVAELQGLDVVEAHWAVRRQAREVHPRVGQSGLPARGLRVELDR